MTNIDRNKTLSRWKISNDFTLNDQRTGKQRCYTTAIK